MDKNAIKKYAVWAREQLIEKVTARAIRYEIVDGQELDGSLETINGEVLPETERKQRKSLIQKIRSDGYAQVMEEVAYTWFNRFVAIRFMEVNSYLPSHVRVFSDENGAFKPQILAEALHLDLPGLDMERVMRYKEEADEGELFKYLLQIQCNALNEILPLMFQKIEDYTELLLPDYLLREGSVIEKLVNDIPEDNFDVNNENGQIEIIGWLYQYYISAKHEEVVDPLHGKVVKKEEVPAATQLFTTDWVVRYLIDNSVGRYWIERNPESKLVDNLTYFVKPKGGVIKTVAEKITPQDVTVFDPCVGSGHFLIYAFDVLMKIYVEYGFSERDAASEIVKNNLFGLDIDGRAVQLAYFAVMMKARQYDRRFLARGIQPKVYEIKESNTADYSCIEYFIGNDDILKNDVVAILDALKDAKEYGSILDIPLVDFERINARFDQISSEIKVSIYTPYLIGDFQSLIHQAEIMCKKYAVVATNPPYFNKYDVKLKEYIRDKYFDYKGDLFSVFIYRNFGYCKKNGYSGLMTPMVWMFISTYEKLRNHILQNKHITTLIQFEYSAYEEATVPICSFVIENQKSESKGQYFRLADFKGGMEVQRQKTIKAIENNDCGYYYESLQDDFSKIPGSPIAYWISKSLLRSFEKHKPLGTIARPRIGQNTGDNNRFLRLWYEVNNTKITIGLKHEEIVYTKYKWLPYNKGGEFRRWYGNQEYLVNWENNGAEIKDYAVIRNHGKHWSRYIQNIENMCKPGITWSFVTSGDFAVRYLPQGFICDVAGSAIFPDTKDILELTALCNSKIASMALQILNPTINMQAGNVASIPVAPEVLNNERIKEITNRCISISKKDWDSFETSWDFSEHPFISSAHRIKDNGRDIIIRQMYEEWKDITEKRFYEVRCNEEELNRIFMDIYELKDELTPEVEDKDVTVRRADLQREIRSFISYAVGCMFGRYSLDVPGLVYAGGEWDASKYKTFQVDLDAIIPICDDEYFEDDIVGRFVKFVEVVYGKDTLEDNLRFIADALGGKGTSREVIRNYFINNFYTDHVKVYQKRPIYWLFDSGKKNGFKCLIYMHRYQPDTIARIRTDYIHEQQARYRTAIEEIEKRIANASQSEKVKLTKKFNKLKDQDEELHVYEEKIHHLADQMISIDLDDGVKHNYDLFQDVLAKIK